MSKKPSSIQMNKNDKELLKWAKTHRQLRKDTYEGLKALIIIVAVVGGVLAGFATAAYLAPRSQTRLAMVHNPVMNSTTIDLWGHNQSVYNIPNVTLSTLKQASASSLPPNFPANVSVDNSFGYATIIHANESGSFYILILPANPIGVAALTIIALVGTAIVLFTTLDVTIDFVYRDIRDSK